MTSDARPSGGPPRALAVVLALVAVVLLAVAVVLGLRVRGDDAADAASVQQQRSDALGVARQQATNLTSLSSNDFEGGLARVRALSTGAFLADLDKTVDSLRKQLSAATFEQRGTLVDSGVVDLDGDKASVILALDQVVTSGQRSRTDALRLQVDLLRTDSRATWLVDNVIFQPSTVSAETAPGPTGSASPAASAPASPTPTASAR
jgi:Mce-associated membrane protein